MQAEYAQAYGNLYRTHWWWRAREDYLVSVLAGRLPRDGTSRILDVGCGGGLFFQRLAGLGEVRGVETDLSMRTGNPAVDGCIHWGPLETLAAAEPFDCILMLDVLEHMDAPAAALREARARLAPGGFLLATVPAFPLLWTRHDDMNQHVRRYTRRTFAPLLAEAGLRAELLRYFFHWTFGAKLLVRAGEMLGRGQTPASVIPSVPPAPVNRGLYLLSRLEQRCFRRLPLPFGSSLLALASRVELAPPGQTS